MKYRTVFDIIGPVMIGPSSSHTAGAARIGRAARTIFGRKPSRAEITLYGLLRQNLSRPRDGCRFGRRIARF